MRYTTYMASLRVTSWYIQAFWNKYKRVIIASVVFGVILVWFFPTLIQLVPRQQKTSYIGRVGLYGWLDVPADIQSKVSTGLTALDETGQPVPVLAQRWTVEEDGRAFRFLLKDNLKWQDGKPFTADDVNYNFTDVQTVATDNTILFRLQDAYAPFPTVVSQPLFRQVKRKRFGFWNENSIIGLGEYRIQSLKYQNTFISQLVITNAQERLVYRFYPSEEDAITAFRSGQVDTIEGLNSLVGLEEREKEMYQVEESVNLNEYVAIFFNNSDANLSKEMRQALNYATRKPGPDDDRLRALSPISPTSWAYNSTEEIEPFSYNLDKAIELYKIVNPPLPLKVTIDTSLSQMEDAQKVAEDWKELGRMAQAACEANPPKDQPDCTRFQIDVQVRALRDLQEFQVALIAREMPSDPDQYSWWHSTQATNLSHYQNPRVDKLLEDARKETSQSKRKILYFEFQRYLVDDAPAMFLYYLPQFEVSRSQLL